MSERITQTQAILMYLEEHGSITCREADRKLGIMRLPSRINDLKKMGYKFVGEMVKVPTRYGGTTRVKRYRLEQEKGANDERK